MPDTTMPDTTMPDTTMPGQASGMTMRVSIANEEAPSIRAASASSRGSPRR